MPTSDPECPFCEIVQRDDPDVCEVYRDEHVVAFFPTEPAVLGHTLLVPRQHVPDIWALTEETARQLAEGTLRLATALREALHPEGLNVIQSSGEAATQSVFHLHIHLVPRWQDDAIGPIWPLETNCDEGEKDHTLDRVRKACRDLGDGRA